VKINHFAQYGYSKLVRVYCKQCKDYAFVIDKTFTCCYSPFLGAVNKIKKMSLSSGIRKYPSVKIMQDLIRDQKDTCLYCENGFNSFYMKNNKIMKVKRNYDHVVPFSYLQESPDKNWILSCNVCNSIKSNKMFKTIQDTKDYIRYEREKRGIVYL